MSRGERLGFVLATALAVVIGCAGTAAAEPGPIRLISKSAFEQADTASEPVISADGRYVALRTTIGRRTGVFREDLETGAFEEVAAGDAYTPGAPGADAKAPSISADGRYVCFTTKARLDPELDPSEGTEDVYVADMAATPPTYRLASILEGSTLAAGAASASPRVALSEDGSKVVFVDSRQVYLRNLESEETTLVSVARDPLSEEMEPGVSVPGGAVIQGANIVAGASISGNGTTVAWLGGHLPAQVPLTGSEKATIEQDDKGGVTPYDEPLWRRIADGPLAPTRRVVGESGFFPDLVDNKNNETENASGWLGFSNVDGVPQLSADGRTVALIGNPNDTVPTGVGPASAIATNLFVVEMGSVPTVQRLTREVIVDPSAPNTTINQREFVPDNGHLFDLAISADGSRIAVATARQLFPLAPPNLTGSPPSSLGLVELYLFDRATETIERLTHGYQGASEPSLAPTFVASPVFGQGATSPSLDAAGEAISFSSIASNLVPGDSNEAADAFTLEDPRSEVQPGANEIQPPPPPAAARPRWNLALSSFSLPNGDVQVTADVPAAGTLQSSAKAVLTVGTKPRRLDSSQRSASQPGPVALTLVLPRRLRQLARSRGGLYALAAVSFTSPRGRKLRGRLQVRFRIHRRQAGEGR